MLHWCATTVLHPGSTCRRLLSTDALISRTFANTTQSIKATPAAICDQTKIISGWKEERKGQSDERWMQNKIFIGEIESALAPLSYYSIMHNPQSITSLREGDVNAGHASECPLSCSWLLRSSELLYLCLIIPNAIMWWNRDTLVYKRTQETFHRGERVWGGRL